MNKIDVIQTEPILGKLARNERISKNTKQRKWKSTQTIGITHVVQLLRLNQIGLNLYRISVASLVIQLPKTRTKNEILKNVCLSSGFMLPNSFQKFVHFQFGTVTEFPPDYSSRMTISFKTQLLGQKFDFSSKEKKKF